MSETHHYRFGNPLRTARGTTTVAATAANVSHAVLQNDGSPNYLLAVLDFTLTNSTNGIVNAGITNGQVLTNTSRPSRVLTGEGAPVGLLGQLIQAAILPGADYTWNEVATQATPWQHDRPFALLRPGAQLWFATNQVNVNMGLAIFYEIIPAAELQYMHELLTSEVRSPG